MVAVVCAVLMVNIVASITPKKWRETEEEYNTRQTVTIGDWNAEATNTAISISEKNSGIGLFFVKVKHVMPNGSGTFITAMTKVEDFKPGDPLTVKFIKVLNSEQMLQKLPFAERPAIKK